ncbi:MAG: hypothetical protein AB7N65_23970, partial [Vicinamibacterales bacterium]
MTLLPYQLEGVLRWWRRPRLWFLSAASPAVAAAPIAGGLAYIGVLAVIEITQSGERGPTVHRRVHHQH